MHSALCWPSHFKVVVVQTNIYFTFKLLACLSWSCQRENQIFFKCIKTYLLCVALFSSSWLTSRHLVRSRLGSNFQSNFHMFYDFASLLPRKSLDHEIDDDFLFTFFSCGVEEEEINYHKIV